MYTGQLDEEMESNEGKNEGNEESNGKDIIDLSKNEVEEGLKSDTEDGELVIHISSKGNHRDLEEETDEKSRGSARVIQCLYYYY